MEEGKGSGSDGPVRDLLELPEEGYAGEAHVDVVIYPVVPLHEGVAAFVAVEAVLDLQPRYDEVDEIGHQEDGEEGVGLAADCVFAFGDDALVEAT